MTVLGEEQVTAVEVVMAEGVYTVVTNEVCMYVQHSKRPIVLLFFNCVCTF